MRELASGLGEIAWLINWRRASEETLAQAQAESEFNANFDPLTELPNRRHFQRHVEEAEASGDDTRRPAAVFLLDLSRFGKTNEAQGHSLGDQVLAEVSMRLRSRVAGGRFLRPDR